MEKTKLVRTFGTALATATLSFGLFAAPAIADPEVKSAGDAKVYAGLVEDWKAIAGTTAITFRVPLTLTDIDASNYDFATITFANSALGHAQELEANVTEFYKTEDGLDTVDVSDLSKYKKVWAEVQGLVVPTQAINGKWSAKDATVYVKGQNPISVEVSGADFTLTDGTKPENVVSPNFEEGSLRLLRSELTSKDDNELSVRFEDEAFNYDTVTAKYTNPAGNSWLFGMGVTGISTTTQDNLYKATTTSLFNLTEGAYTLDELVVRRPVTTTETETVTYDVTEGKASETFDFPRFDTIQVDGQDVVCAVYEKDSKPEIKLYLSVDGKVYKADGTDVTSRCHVEDDTLTIDPVNAPYVDAGKYTMKKETVTIDARRDITVDGETVTGTVYDGGYVVDDEGNIYHEVDGAWVKDDEAKMVDGKVNKTITDTWEYTSETGLFDVDYYAPLAGGNYVVNAGLVIPMYRAYNPYDGQHLYTDSAEEMAAAVAAGWTDEGIAWFAPANIWDSAVKKPVYRLYNQYNGDHHYTTGKAEAEAMIAAGWTDEGIGFFSLIETATMGSPVNASAQAVYRVFNPFEKVGTHHYTTSLDEYNDLVDLGWKGENVGWYGVKWEKSFR